MECIYSIHMLSLSFCLFKQKTAYELRISDWSSDVCSSDLGGNDVRLDHRLGGGRRLSRCRRLDARREPLPADPLRADHAAGGLCRRARRSQHHSGGRLGRGRLAARRRLLVRYRLLARQRAAEALGGPPRALADAGAGRHRQGRSEEHTSELQSLMRISYAVFCLKKKKVKQQKTTKYK